MRLVSDTGLGSSKVDRGWLVALPAGPEVTWALLDASRGSDLTHADLRLAEEDVLGADGLWQPVEGGRFDLPVESGEYVLCFVVPADYGPGVVRGCAEVTLGDTSRIDATWGEGGFRVQVDR